MESSSFYEKATEFLTNRMFVFKQCLVYSWFQPTLGKTPFIFPQKEARCVEDFKRGCVFSYRELQDRISLLMDHRNGGATDERSLDRNVA